MLFNTGIVVLGPFICPNETLHNFFVVVAVSVLFFSIADFLYSFIYFPKKKCSCPQVEKRAGYTDVLNYDGGVCYNSTRRHCRQYGKKRDCSRGSLTHEMSLCHRLLQITDKQISICY